MGINIHSVVIIDKNFKEYIKDKFEKLEKFIFDSGNLDLYIRKEGPFYISEIKIRFKGHDVFLKEKNSDLNKSIEILFDRAKRQVRKMHDQVVNRPHK